MSAASHGPPIAATSPLLAPPIPPSSHYLFLVGSHESCQEAASVTAASNLLERANLLDCWRTFAPLVPRAPAASSPADATETTALVVDDTDDTLEVADAPAPGIQVDPTFACKLYDVYGSRAVPPEPVSRLRDLLYAPHNSAPAPLEPLDATAVARTVALHPGPVPGIEMQSAFSVSSLEELRALALRPDEPPAVRLAGDDRPLRLRFSGKLLAAARSSASPRATPPPEFPDLDPSLASPGAGDPSSSGHRRKRQRSRR